MGPASKTIEGLCIELARVQSYSASLLPWYT
jgi:hypothetical protein